MYYEKEYNEAKDIDEFIKLITSKYDILDASARRRWYLLRSKLKPKTVLPETIKISPSYKNYANSYADEDKIEPTFAKKLLFGDLKKFLKKQNMKEYKKNGLTKLELNWFEDNGDL